MLEDLGGKPLIEHAAGVIAGLDALARVAVCPGDRHGDRRAPDRPLRHRGEQAAEDWPRPFDRRRRRRGAEVQARRRPALHGRHAVHRAVDARRASWSRLGGDPAATSCTRATPDGVRPPTAFSLGMLQGAARRSMATMAPSASSGRAASTWSAHRSPAPLLVDVDTREELSCARATGARAVRDAVSRLQ